MDHFQRVENFRLEFHSICRLVIRVIRVLYERADPFCRFILHELFQAWYDTLLAVASEAEAVRIPGPPAKRQRRE